MLWHATRRHEGPWAGQGESEFLDELLFERPERDRSALATLRRIIGERRLRASLVALRGQAIAFLLVTSFWWGLLAFLVGWLDRLSRGYMTARLSAIGVALGLSIPSLAFLL